ncbi:MAG TPA: LysM peptidoglycan-binding domain-containing protein, partial [Myxococcota bacterium]|nr:LysM peptidoglycan-binding domain-containing protein [Myxococcota bacterium]
FREGLERAGQWAPHIRASLEAYGVPAELASLPHVESSFNPSAYSRVGAAGLWQFTRSTGRLFLRVDSVIDERMDPFAASDGAARLLRSNYDALGSWPLAITAYNHGVGGMKRAMSTLGTDDIATVIAKYKSRSFGFASRNFYTEFLAAHDVDSDAERYFGPINALHPVRYETATLEHYVPAEAVERALGIDGEILREHNRALRPAVWNGTKHIPQGFVLRVPAGHLERPLEVALASIPATERFAQQHRDRLYTVHRGDSLSKIARAHGVKESELIALNNLRSRHRIRAGQVLVLPDAPGAEPAATVALAQLPDDGVYRVRRGDTISKIAARFGLSEAQLVSLNGLSNRHQIAVGQRLRVAASDAAPASVAASDVARATAPASVVEPRPVTVAAVEPRPVTVAAVDAHPVTVAAVEPRLARDEPALELGTSAAARAGSASALTAPRGGASEPAAGAVAEVLAAEIEADPTLADEVALHASEVAAVLDDLTSETPAIASVVVPAPDPSDYAVSDDDRIIVQANETLGHYADWLEIPTSRLRRLNRLRAGTAVGIGRPTQLDFSVVSREQFVQRRLEYHHTLQEEFFAAYEVVGTDSHELERGDTLWYLAEKRYRVPVWLLRQYNPTLDFSALQAGGRLVVPVLASREE